MACLSSQKQSLLCAGGPFDSSTWNSVGPGNDELGLVTRAAS